MNSKKADPEVSSNNISTKNRGESLGKSFLFTLLFGIILLLVSVIINVIQFQETMPTQLLFIIRIFTNILQNIGIALMIAYFFTYVSSTQSFIDFIKDKLISIIITKDFLSKINNDERLEMMRNILKPVEDLPYHRINDYFNKHITQSLSLFETHFRSSYQINAIAKIDEEKNKVRVDVELRYRMYKVSGKFEDLNIGFEDETVEEQPVNIYTPDGKKEIIEVEIENREDLLKKGKKSFFENDLSLIKESFAKKDPLITQRLEKYEYLDVENRFTEFGNDHWHLLTFRIMTPCDGLSILISCDSKLTIKKFIPFGDLNSFNVNLRDENKIIDIFCNEWVEAGLGVAILIAKKDIIT